MRVLIVEDEAKMAGLIQKGLRQEAIAADVQVLAQTVSGGSEREELISYKP